MNESRRRFLGSLGALGVTASAGCVGVLGGGGDEYPNVVLGKRDPPDDLTMEQYRARRWPVWNERVPDVEVPAALADRTVALREVSTPSILTFFYSSCTTFCPRLVSSMANMQDHAIENGYAEEVTFLPITFDPERDTPETLREYRDRMNVEKSDNWYFLRPESKARAKTVVEENFVGFTRVETDGGGDDFAHRGLHLLVNADGYVERAYQIERGEAPRTQDMIDDLRKIRNA